MGQSSLVGCNKLKSLQVYHKQVYGSFLNFKGNTFSDQNNDLAWICLLLVIADRVEVRKVNPVLLGGFENN